MPRNTKLRKVWEMNRQQRRAVKPKKKPIWHGLTKEEKQEKLFRNGITIKDLEANYAKGFDAGFAAASEPIVRTLYAAVCLTLNELHGFGRERCMKVLQVLDNHLLTTLASDEAIDEVYKRMKLEINFAEPFDRIEMSD